MYSALVLSTLINTAMYDRMGIRAFPGVERLSHELWMVLSVSADDRNSLLSKEITFVNIVVCANIYIFFVPETLPFSSSCFVSVIICTCKMRCYDSQWRRKGGLWVPHNCEP